MVSAVEDETKFYDSLVFCAPTFFKGYRITKAQRSHQTTFTVNGGNDFSNVDIAQKSKSMMPFIC